MKRKLFPILRSVFGIFFSIFILNSMPRSSGLLLIKIEKPGGSARLFSPVEGARLIQSLESGWIAVCSSGRGPTLGGRGISFQILDTDPAGKTYYLVRLPAAGDIVLLKKLGNVRRLEDRLCLFWCDRPEVREILPSRFLLKQLPTGTIPLQALQSRPGPQRKRDLRSSRNPIISRTVNQVSGASLGALIRKLEDFQTRYSSTPQCESAGTYLFNFLNDLGLQTGYDSFSFGNGYVSRNVVGVIPGRVAPDREVIICGHYDSFSDQARTLAPGADDNASGTAAVMELARIMKDQAFNFSLKFICFSAEEWGLLGSQHYALEGMRSREKIIGVINMDMIAFVDKRPEDLDLIVDRGSEWLADEFSAAAEKYAPLPLLKIVDASFSWSDHSSFWDQGFSALCGIEDAEPANPNYHQTTDTLDKLDLDFCASVARAELAAAAELAEPLSSPPAPTGLRAQSQISSSLFWAIKTVYLNWNSAAGATKGYNIYRTTASHGTYQRINSSLLGQPSYVDSFLDPDTKYYYVVTALDDLGRESNYSEEVKDDENNG